MTTRNEYQAAYSQARKNLQGVQVNVVFFDGGYEIQTLPCVCVTNTGSDYIREIVSQVIANKYKGKNFIVPRSVDATDWDEEDNDYVED